MSLTNEDKQWISEQIGSQNEASEQRVSERLTQQLERVETNILTEFHRGFERIDARLDRQGGLLRSGQTNLVRLNNWSEKMDKMLKDRDKRIDELEARLKKLESRTGDAA